MSGATHRVYFALWPDPALRAELSAAVAPVLTGLGGRPVQPANLHLTLEFIGAVAASQLDRLLALGATLSWPAVTLTLDYPEWWRGSQALVLRVLAPAEPLLALQAALRRRIAELGLAVDDRPYRPHVTIAREVAAQPAHATPVSVAWRAATVALIESHPAPGGSHYRPLGLWHAADAKSEFPVI